MSGKVAKNRRAVFQPRPWEMEFPVSSEDYPSNKEVNALEEGYVPLGKLDDPINPDDPWSEGPYTAKVRNHSMRGKQ